MRDFKIRKINEHPGSFDAEVEFKDNGDREKFSFPKGNGWDVMIDDVPKYVRHIQEILYKRGKAEVEDSTKLMSAEGMDFNYKDYEKFRDKKPVKNEVEK